MEWVRFTLTAVLLACSVFCFASAVLGVYSFGFILNRIHASGIGDSLGLFCAVLAVMIGSGEVKRSRNAPISRSRSRLDNRRPSEDRSIGM